ncbi:MAG: UTP--glucose-1-phosphate uridylyltransferase [Planctomycetaceae bacterium]|nr:UTP--glucose-1-phosphate uridylyltransferase [Planctomycetaceae bacterium]
MSATNPLIATITSSEPAVRDRALADLIVGLSTPQVLLTCDELEAFRRSSENLYERVRASMFLYALYRYRIQEAPEVAETGLIPFSGFEDLLGRRFEQAIAAFLATAGRDGLNSALASALAQAYEQVTYQTLADQVRRSVRGCAGNRWMFRVGHADEHPIRLDARLLERDPANGQFPILLERTPVRLDLSHSGWSDIFFLGMDYPEGARVLNISVDLGVHGRDAGPLPPIETFVRVITEPLLRLTSIDLGACKDVKTLDELFNFGNDYLGLVKAGVIASGLIPPSLEGTGISLSQILERIIRPGYGLEVVSKVNDIPKGSRLAVSTNLLASLISLLMRATGQSRQFTGPQSLEESRVVVSRAILGEWLGGSGGGWQDSGGVFPGVKLIQGVAAGADDPEWNVSRGRLLPVHRVLTGAPAPGDVKDAPRAAKGATGDSNSGFAEALASSLVLVHGGMAQNVGPILNMVTEKYLLRGGNEWRLRQQALQIFDELVQAVDNAAVRDIGRLTTANWDGPLKGIIPWVSNCFTETIIREARSRLGEDFWGFLMLGGMSGGGMGFFVAPHRHAAFRDEIREIMLRVKGELGDALPFAMEPVVYDFHINPHGTHSELRTGREALMPSRYYPLQVSRMIAEGAEGVDSQRKLDVDHFANRNDQPEELIRVFRTMVNTLFPAIRTSGSGRIEWDQAAEEIRRENGFDPVQHAQLRDDLQRGRIGLARNRLPVDTEIRDVADADVIALRRSGDEQARRLGAEAISRGEAAVVSLAAGVGSRWTTGAGVVKAINPFVALEGRHRSFLEIHLAKTCKTAREFAARVPHVVTTSFLTHAAIARHLERTGNDGHTGPVLLSRGQSIGQRLIPMARDLTFLWDESVHETLDENKQKVREAGRRAILEWARGAGEATDYTDNVPIQRFNPPGHFYEIPNLLRNGVLLQLLRDFPRLRWLMVHNIDTLGANLDPTALGLAMQSGATLAFEVVPRRIDDRGGGLARVNGRVRILEGLATPREEAEFQLRYYNTLTTWVDIESLLKVLGLTRADLEGDQPKVTAAIRALAARVPTYVTIKDVKRRWGHGQEDVFPVAQFEKLWGDLTSLTDLGCAFLAVDRRRGQQLKDPAQLDGWSNDGNREHVTGLCEFS